jgi:pyrroline-5-carboxylate reductase
MKIGFIGLGNMAGAMIGGIISKNIIKKEDIIGADAFSAATERAAEMFGIKTMMDNTAIVEQADIIILSVKPQLYETVINGIKKAVRKEQIIITIAPGKTIAWLTKQFGDNYKFVRCMPNTPALVGEGCTGVCMSEKVTEEEKEQVMRILNSFGKAYIVAEHLMDAVVAVSGSSPAYVFMMIEAMADEAVLEGLPRALAYEFAAQAVLGSAKMVLDTGKHPGELKDMVCSPGGTTIEAVKVLEEQGFRAGIMAAMKACAQKSREL